MSNKMHQQSIMDKIMAYLLSPTDPSNLGVFRFVFGFLMMLDITQERGFAHIYEIWESDMCYFSLFSFLKPLSYDWMHVVYIVMFFGAVGVMLGFLYRLSCLMLLIPYWYLFILDKAVWNNHSYLYGLIALMLLITDSNRYWSIDGLLFPEIRNVHIPKWNYTIFKFQIFLVYFFAGIKKIDHDWMGGYSMTGLARKWVFDPFRPFLSNENIDFYLVHMSGLCYDLFVGFFLLFDKTRFMGILFSLAFHGMNSQMFSIGMFAYTMMASLPLFCSERWPKNLLSRLPPGLSFITPPLGDASPSTHCIYPSQESEKIDGHKVHLPRKDGNQKTLVSGKNRVKVSHKIMLMIFSLYVGIQCFLPYSHFLTKGYNGWTQGLYGYSWDMMVHSWTTQHVRINVVDQATGNQVFIRPGVFVGGGQRAHSRWNSHSDMIKQYATCLAQKLKERTDINISEPAIYLDVWRSLNQRFQQRFVDPNVNLVTAPWSPFTKTPWMLPLLTELSSWREKMKEIEEKQNKADMGNFTEIVFVADFPGLNLENYVSEELNTTLTVLRGRVNVEANGKNDTLGENEEITVPSNDTHVVYTVSDTPACWMYVYLNTTVLKNETLKQWILHPETHPSSEDKAKKQQRPALERFREFMSQKSMLYYVSFWNSYHAISHLTMGIPYPWEEEANNTNEEQDQGASEQQDVGDAPGESDSGDQDSIERNEDAAKKDADETMKEPDEASHEHQDVEGAPSERDSDGQDSDGGEPRTNLKSEL